MAFLFVSIARHEVGLIFDKRGLSRVVTGKLILDPRLFGERLEIVDMRELRFEHPMLEVLLKDSEIVSRVVVLRVGDDERGLVWGDGRLRAILGPGRHVFWKELCELQGQVVSVRSEAFKHNRLEVILENGGLADDVEVVEVGDDQRALVFRGGRFEGVLQPGRHVLWKSHDPPRVEVLEVTEPRVRHPQLERLARSREALSSFVVKDVPANEVALFYVNGEFQGVLPTGRHLFWEGIARYEFKAVDLRERLLEISGQEIMTRDKLSLRANLSVSWQVVDPERSAEVSQDPEHLVYREAQLALRDAMGGRTLEELLAAKAEVGAEVCEAVAIRARELGVVIRSAGLRDLILPGEMKTILNQVIEAQKRSEAQVITRREESAALRSQLNGARLLAENPVLLRMKELETLEKILEGTSTTFVLGNGDLLDQLRSTIGKRE